MKKPLHIVVIGVSAGGLGALQKLVAQLDNKMNAAFFIVMHLAERISPGFLLNWLQPGTQLTCVQPRDEMEIMRGHIYIAAPDHHLLVKKNKIVLGNGPREGRWKPSINILFRSAAAAYGAAVTGIILTGMLDDGVTGMLAIKKCGGHTIVQDPSDAEYPDMPLSVLSSMDVDYCVPLTAMGDILSRILAVAEIKQQ